MNHFDEIEPFRYVKAVRRLFQSVQDRIRELLDGDFSDEIKFEALLTLGKIGDPQALELVQQALDAYPDRPEPIMAVGLMRNSTPVAKLIKLLEMPDASCKEEIVRVLGEIGDPMAEKVLQDHLYDSDRMVRYYAAWALYRIGGRDVAQSLCRLLSDPDEWIVINVLEILSRLKETEAIPALVGQFEIGRDPRLKAIIISALGTFAEPQLLSIFEEGLRSFDPRIQANSVEAISLLKIPALEMKRKLKKLYSHPNNRVRANVAIALHKADAVKVREEVETMMQSADFPTRRSAAYVLTKVDLENRDALIDTLLTDSQYQVRKMALKAALALQTNVGMMRVIPLLEDENVWVRKEAVDCARRIVSFPPSVMLDAFAKEKSSPVLESMLDFFVERHVDNAVPAILELIRGGLEEILPKLIHTLGYLNAAEALHKARKFLGTSTTEILREFYIALLLHGELEVLEEIGAILLEKTREEELLTYLQVAGDVGRFLSAPEKYSEALRTQLAKEVAKDLEGVVSFDAPASSMPRPTLESVNEGIELFSQGRLPEAATFFAKFLQTFPEHVDALYHYATILFRLGEPEKALPFLLQLMEKVPGHVAGGILLGQLHFQKKRWEDLLQLYEALKDLIPTDDRKSLGTVQGALGLAYFHLKRYQKAIEILGEAMQTNPRDMSSCYHLALSYYAVKEHSRAIQLLKGLRRSLPSDSRVLRNVEELLQRLDEEM